MKKRTTIIAIVTFLLVLVIALMVVAGCTPPAQGPDTNVKKQIIKPLADLTDYGAQTYLKVAKVIYNPEVEEEQGKKIADKQDESREDFIEEGEEGEEGWNSEKYYAFNKPDFKKLPNEEFTEENGGYEWDDSRTSTVTQIFCYADSGEIIDRMALAGIEEARMQEIVKYITRVDASYKDFHKGDERRYPLELGKGSAIFDYENLDEIQDIRDNFNSYKSPKKNADNEEVAFGHTKEWWEDMARLKKRKVYGEIFTIFKDRGDLFARFQTEYMTYQLEVISEIMIPAYKSADKPDLGSPAIADNILINTEEFKNYLRDEVFDYEMLSYFLSFAEMTLPKKDAKGKWTDTKRDTIMRIYGYTYQYEKAGHEVFDDKKMVKGKTEFRDYLALGHEEYYDNKEDAVRYVAYDRKSYRESRRYTAEFYKKFYQAQYEIQSRQEKYDREIYVLAKKYDAGIGYGTNNNIAYTDELLEGLQIGMAANLKISDINYEYTGVENNVVRYNSTSAAWLSLSNEQQAQILNKIKKVRYQLEQLKSQHYMLQHTTKTNADLTNALKYQIKSYSADYIKEIQRKKKEEVINTRKLINVFDVINKDREDKYAYTEDITVFEKNNPEVYHKNAVANKIEDLGRGKAMAENLSKEFNPQNVTEQMSNANSADWKGVTGNVSETLKKDYEGYDAKQRKNPKSLDTVDKYFEDQLIKRKWNCQKGDKVPANPDDCQINPDWKVNRDSHDDHMHFPNGDREKDPIACEKEYDTTWALSKLLNTHEKVLRHMSGTTEIKFQKLDKIATYYNPEKPWGESVAPYLSQEIQKIPAKRAMWVESEKETLESGKELRKLVLENEDNERNNEDTERNFAFQPNYTIGIVGEKTLNGYNSVYKTENCIYEFDAWCVDEDLLYEVNLDDKIRFSIYLYPRYKVTNIKEPETTP